MMAPSSILGATIFGNPGGTHVLIGADGTITGYYADGKKAYDLVPGAAAAITTYGDNAPGIPRVSLKGGLIVFSPANNTNKLTISPISFNVGSAALFFQAQDVGISAEMDLVLATTNTFAWSADVWSALTPGTGWDNGTVGGATVQVAQSRLDAEDNIIVTGAMNTTSATPNNTIFTLGSGHRPAKAYRFGMDVYSSAGAYKGRSGLTVLTSGAVQQSGFAFASGDIVAFDLVIPRGNLG